MRTLRRAVFQVHLWTGLVLGLYLLMMSITGAILVFEDEVRASLHPHLYHASGRQVTTIGVAPLMDNVRAQYPTHRIYRVYAPTTRRDTYLVILERDSVFPKIFVDAATGQIIGEGPHIAGFAWAWEAHANLFAGTSGRIFNCTLGLFVLLIPVTGVFLWWPRADTWSLAFWNTPNRAWNRARSLHAVLGLWSAVFIAMFAATGALYYYGPTFWRGFGMVSRLSVPPRPYSDPAAGGPGSAAAMPAMIDAARKAAPVLNLQAVYPPMSDKSPIRLVMGEVGDDLGTDHWEWNNVGQRHLYFDQYSGKLLATWDVRQQTVADVIRAWIVPLHRGNFAGTGVKGLWVVAGLSPAVLAILGFVIWLQRRNRRLRRQRP